MIRVKEALTYLVEYLSEAGGPVETGLTAETVRRSKANDSGASADLQLFIGSLLAKVHGFKFAHGISRQAAKDLLNLYLCLNLNPFVLAVDGEDYYDLDSPQSLLKILCWLLFSTPNLLKRLDSLYFDSLKKAPATPAGPKQPQANPADQAQAPPKAYQDIADLTQLKSLLFLRVDQLKAAGQAAQKAGKAVHSQMPPAMYKYVSDPSFAAQVIEEKEQKMRQLERFKEEAIHRKTVLEWMASTVDEEKKASPGFEQLRDPGDLEDAEAFADDQAQAKLVQFQAIYNDLSRRLEAMHRQSAEIKRFSKFWEETSQKLASNSDYKRKISATVARETLRLENKYKKPMAKQQPQEAQKQIDIFKILVDLQNSRNADQTKPKPPEPKVKQLANPKAGETVKRVKQEFEGFLQEVQEYLSEQDIFMIRK